jgi:hypothetical protein
MDHAVSVEERAIERDTGAHDIDVVLAIVVEQEQDGNCRPTRLNTARIGAGPGLFFARCWLRNDVVVWRDI